MGAKRPVRKLTLVQVMEDESPNKRAVSSLCRQRGKNKMQNLWGKNGEGQKPEMIPGFLV